MLLDVADVYRKTTEGWRFAERAISAVMIPADARAKLAQHVPAVPITPMSM